MVHYDLSSPPHSAQTLVIPSSVSYRRFPFYPKCFNPQDRWSDPNLVFYNVTCCVWSHRISAMSKMYELAVWLHHSAGQFKHHPSCLLPSALLHTFRWWLQSNHSCPQLKAYQHIRHIWEHKLGVIQTKSKQNSMVEWTTSGHLCAEIRREGNGVWVDGSGKTSQITFYKQWHLFLVVEFTLPSSGASPAPPFYFCNHSELPLINSIWVLNMTFLLVFEFKPIHLHQGRKTHKLHYGIIF